MSDEVKQQAAPDRGTGAPDRATGVSDRGTGVSPVAGPGYGYGYGYGYGPGAGYGGARPGPEVSLGDYLRMLHKRRWTAISAFAAALLVVAVYTLTLTPV
jgi:hypothetical protein